MNDLNGVVTTTSTAINTCSPNTVDVSWLPCSQFRLVYSRSYENYCIYLSIQQQVRQSNKSPTVTGYFDAKYSHLPVCTLKQRFNCMTRVTEAAMQHCQESMVAACEHHMFNVSECKQISHQFALFSAATHSQQLGDAHFKRLRSSSRIPPAIVRRAQ